MRSYERNYHSSKGELLALFFGLGKFSHILKGQEFLVRTDNLTVTYWETASLSSNPILSRWLDFLAQFSFSVKHISGKFLIPADVLSRLIDGGNDEEGEGEIAQIECPGGNLGKGGNPPSFKPPANLTVPVLWEALSLIHI